MPGDPQPHAARQANVRFGYEVLTDALKTREDRKERQENTARAVVITAGTLMTVLLGLSKDAGVLTSDSPAAARVALAVTLIGAVAAILCAGVAMLPRAYNRLTAGSLTKFSEFDYLDQEPDAVIGPLVATQAGLAGTMDTRHEEKARWLKASFALMLVAFLGLAAQGITLAVDPPTPKAQTTTVTMPTLPPSDAVSSR